MQNGIPLRKVHTDSRSALMAGIDELANTVASTLGAAGKTVILEDPTTSLPYVTKDGVTVAEYINPIEPVANLGASLVREASKKTAAQAGDGTTTSTVLAKSILDYAIPLVNDGNFRQVIKGIKNAQDKVIAAIDKKSTVVTDKNLKDIATISANNDSVIGGIIAEAYGIVGLQGSVLVSNSDTADTHITSAEGSTISSGYVSSHFANQQNGDCVLENPKILIIDQKVDSIWKIENILEGVLGNSEALLIIGDLDPQAVATLAMNCKKGFKICVVAPPLHGHMKTTVLEDIGKLTGANVVGEEYGTSLTTAAYPDLGDLKRVTVNAHEAIFQFNKRNKKIDLLVDELHHEAKTADVRDIGLIKYRLNVLTGKLATIKVGAITETALKELKDRVDDSVHATKCALQEGIIPGGGVILKDISNDLCCKGNEYEDILYKAILTPLATILSNGGYKVEDFGGIDKVDIGVDVLTGKKVNVLKAGIIDPTKVTKNAIINAVDVACTVLSTDYIVTNLRTNEI